MIHSGRRTAHLDRRYQRLRMSLRAGTWLLTIPAADLVAAAFYWPIEGIF